MKEKELPNIGMHNLQGCLVITVQCEPDDQLLLDLQEKTLEIVKESLVKGVIIALSDVKIIDASIFKSIDDIGKMLSLLGARTIISGIRPEDAASLADYDCRASHTLTAVSVEHGYQLLQQEGVL